MEAVREQLFLKQIFCGKESDKVTDDDFFAKSEQKILAIRAEYLRSKRQLQLKKIEEKENQLHKIRTNLISVVSATGLLLALMSIYLDNDVIYPFVSYSIDVILNCFDDILYFFEGHIIILLCGVIIVSFVILFGTAWLLRKTYELIGKLLHAVFSLFLFMLKVIGINIRDLIGYKDRYRYYESIDEWSDKHVSFKNGNEQSGNDESDSENKKIFKLVLINSAILLAVFVVFNAFIGLNKILEIEKKLDKLYVRQDLKKYLMEFAETTEGVKGDKLVVNLTNIDDIYTKEIVRWLPSLIDSSKINNNNRYSKLECVGGDLKIWKSKNILFPKLKQINGDLYITDDNIKNKFSELRIVGGNIIIDAGDKDKNGDEVEKLRQKLEDSFVKLEGYTVECESVQMIWGDNMLEFKCNALFNKENIKINKECKFGSDDSGKGPRSRNVWQSS